MMTDILAFFVDRDSDTQDILKLRKAYLNWFVYTYPETEFVHEDLLIWHYMKYIDFFEATVSMYSLNTFISTELHPLISKKGIRVSGTHGLNLEDLGMQIQIVNITIAVLTDLFETATNKEYSLSNFLPIMNTWLSERLKLGLISMYNEGMSIIESMKNKNTGTRDAMLYTFAKASDLHDLYNSDKLLELIETPISENQFNFITNLGIAPLDAVTGGLFSTEMVSIEAPPGIGKSKFVVCQIMWRAAVLFKRNNLFFTLEQTEHEIDSLLVARHFHYLYREQVDEASIRLPIYYDKLPEEVKQKINVARDDLYNNKDYGKIKVLSTSLDLDVLIPRIKRQDKLSGSFDIIYIDYVGLITQGNLSQYQRQKADYQVIGEALRQIKNYVRNACKLAIVVNQLNASGAQKAARGDKLDVSDAQGGMIVYQSTDKNFVIRMTEEQRVQQKRTIEIRKGRGVAHLISVECSVKLSMGLFLVDKTDVIVKGD